MEEIARRLGRIRVFDQLPEAECLALIREAQRVRLESTEYLFHQGDVWPCVLFVLAGELRWQMLSLGGREHVLFTVGSDDVFWGHSLFDDEQMPASLVASTKSEAMVWNRETILPHLFNYPRMLWEVTKMQVETMRQARKIIYGLAFQPVSARLAGLLLESFEDHSEEATIDRDFTLSEMATMVASSPEVVCRMLHQFQASGVLEVTRARITLRDPQGLRNILEQV